MRARIDQNCTGCGLCADRCPDVFAMTDAQSTLRCDLIPAQSEMAAQEAAANCPAEAIWLE